MSQSMLRNRPANRLLGCFVVLGVALTAGGCADDAGLSVSPASASAVLIAAVRGEVASDAAPIAGSPYGSYLAGLFAGSQRDLSMAADFMLESLAYDPDNEQLLNRAFILVAGDGRHDQAVDLAGRLTARDPDHGLAALVLAVDAVQRGAIEDASAFLSNFPERGLSTVTVPLLGGWLQVAKGDVEAALAAVAPLKEKNGFNVFHGLHAALMNDVAGRETEAREAYEEVLQLSGQPTLRLALLAGNFFERSGAVEQAREIYREFLDRNADSVLVTAAWRRIESGAVPVPIVADATAGMAEALFNLASLLSKERAEEVALIHAHMALRLKPDFIIARELLGEILQAQSRGQDAIAVYLSIPD